MFSHVNKKQSIYKLSIFLLLYLNIWLTFTVIYCVLDIINLGAVVDHYASAIHQGQRVDQITRSLYLSAITLLSVGFGDVTPFGWSRGAAIIQALIGYLLPAVIVIQFISPYNNGTNQLKRKFHDSKTP
ncbi:potassium channel family protein [Bacillus sp. Marseille-Q3570]|uniref:potassium channel family protein n=1 Tax=Bacillus sp. Marseille-Q3570 TaxID=2963522 RepID=UPI0021B77FB4|nr:potassium channel family protein [Bacillus sp. Marseille-Q3570]